MHHTKTDSDATSLTASSPPRSPPRRPVYFVQSPPHEDEKNLTTISFHSTPTGSPPHSSVGFHSRESSSTRFSGSLKPNGPQKIVINNNDVALKRFNSIEEEGLLDDDYYHAEKKIPRRCYVLAFVLGFFILFGLFALILYGASKPQKPKLTMRSITFERFMVQAGSDFTGVATDMVTMNSTVKFTFRNTATFFGLHVTSTPLDLAFSQIAVGSGTIKKFYQKRKSQRLVTVSVVGDKVPLYGSGQGLKSLKGIPTTPVPLKLSFKVRSRGYVL
ncbi:putative late embryogenesis abundant protein, LEA-14, partial [Tanacetum coccineum]